MIVREIGTNRRNEKLAHRGVIERVAVVIMLARSKDFVKRWAKANSSRITFARRLTDDPMTSYSVAHVGRHRLLPRRDRRRTICRLFLPLVRTSFLRKVMSLSLSSLTNLSLRERHLKCFRLVLFPFRVDRVILQDRWSWRYIYLI